MARILSLIGLKSIVATQTPQHSEVNQPQETTCYCADKWCPRRLQMNREDVQLQTGDPLVDFIVLLVLYNG